MNNNIPANYAHVAADATNTQPWVVLVVDDEPEIHKVTRLLLSDVSFLGKPLEILEASSAEQAQHLLTCRRDTALVLLDVVMESDNAGLELTNFIRNVLGDEDVQIILRTGHPGSAPEQEVILNYDINGYFLKTEITAQKLRSVVIGALRNFGYIKKLRSTVSEDTDQAASASHTSAIRAEASQQPVFDTGGLVLSAEPIVRLHDHAWHALQLSACFSIHPSTQNTLVNTTDPKSSEHKSTATAGDSSGRTTLEQAVSINNQAAYLQLDAWLLQRACELASQIHISGQHPVDLIVPIASAGSQLSNIPGIIATCLKRFDVSGGRLVLELREAAMVLDQTSSDGVIDELLACGVRIALVHSSVSIVSLRRLRDIRPSMLKIPSELIHEISSDGATATMVRAIIALAHTLDMSAVAEGVSSQSDLEFLRWEGCDLAYGPLVSSSLPKAEAVHLFGRPMGVATMH